MQSTALNDISIDRGPRTSSDLLTVMAIEGQRASAVASSSVQDEPVVKHEEWFLLGRGEQSTDRSEAVFLIYRSRAGT